MNALVQRAKNLATRAHAEQVDKAGRPYIEHCARVAEAVREDRQCANEDCNGLGEIVHWDSVGCSDPACCSPATSPCPTCDQAEAVAWLHDVLEDCIDSDEEDFFDTIHIEFPAPISDACRALIRPVSPYEQDDYYACIRGLPLALRVKLADIADNADESRLALLDPETASRLRRKYYKAMRALTDDSMTLSAREG